MVEVFISSFIGQAHAAAEKTPDVDVVDSAAWAET